MKPPARPFALPRPARALANPLLPALLLSGCVAAPPSLAPPPAPLSPPVAPLATGATGAVTPPQAAALGALDLPGAQPATTLATPSADGTVPVSLLDVPDNVFFDFGAPAPRPDAGPALDALAHSIAQTEAPLVLTVAGNTDAVGSDSYNQALSVERARSVVAALVARGVPASRLQAVGFGRTRPVASNDTDDGRARNRRVELALSPSFAANQAALASAVPPQPNVPDAAVPQAPTPTPSSIARRLTPVNIHANTPERIRANSLGPNLSY